MNEKELLDTLAYNVFPCGNGLHDGNSLIVLHSPDEAVLKNGRHHIDDVTFDDGNTGGFDFMVSTAIESPPYDKLLFIHTLSGENFVGILHKNKVFKRITGATEISVKDIKYFIEIDK